MKNINKVLSNIHEYWSPIIVGEMNDNYLKVAKLKGEFVKHNHKNTDEVFIILKGSLKMEYEDTVFELNEGDIHVVKKGVFHRPVANEECHVLLFESKQTKHTGDVISDFTKSVEEQRAKTLD